MVENQPKRLRKGESPGKPWGGAIADRPFSQALFALACSRGFQSQLALARALGKKDNRTTRQWYVSGIYPRPESLGEILQVLKPNEPELETLLTPWVENLRAKAKKPKALKVRELKYEFGKRIVEQALEHGRFGELTPRQQAVLRLRYIETNKPQHQRKVGQVLGVTPQRIQRLERRALEILSKTIANTI